MHNYPMSNISHTYLNNKTHYRVYANCNCQRDFMDIMKDREVVPVKYGLDVQVFSLSIVGKN